MFVNLRTFKFLAITSVIGDIALTVAMITVLYFGFKYDPPMNPDKLPPFRLETFPLFFGSAAFLFCIHMVVSLPVAER